MPQAEPKLVWAVGKNGRMAHISEVENGLKCACVCPICNGALIAKQGRIRQRHFAHAYGDDCYHAPETALHSAAKEILEACKVIALPEVTVHAGWRLSPERYLLQSIAVEKKIGSIIPDAIAQIEGRKLLIEVIVTHGVDKDKLREIIGLGLSCIEICLSKTDRDISRRALEEIIVDRVDHKRWLYNAYVERKKAERAPRLDEVTRWFLSTRPPRPPFAS